MARAAMLLAGALVSASSAWADAPDEFELDLSEAKAVPPTLRPRLAVVSVTAADDDSATAEQVDAIEGGLQALCAEGQHFASVLAPADVKARLGASAADADCTTYACFEHVAHVLDVHRALRITVEQTESGGPLVTLLAFDPAISSLVTETFETPEDVLPPAPARAQRDRDFLARVSPLLQARLAKLATPNALLVVTTGAPTSVIAIDGAPAGLGTVEFVTQRGVHQVRVTAAGYQPFATQVSIGPLETRTVEVHLTPVAQPPPPPKPVPYVRRPGLYVGATGLAVTAAGLVLGLLAASVAGRIDPSARPMSVTRAEAKAAAREAVAANVLLPVGFTTTAAGALWFLFHPPEAVRPSLTAQPEDAR